MLPLILIGEDGGFHMEPEVWGWFNHLLLPLPGTLCKKGGSEIWAGFCESSTVFHRGVKIHLSCDLRSLKRLLKAGTQIKDKEIRPKHWNNESNGVYDYYYGGVEENSGMVLQNDESFRVRIAPFITTVAFIYNKVRISETIDPWNSCSCSFFPLSYSIFCPF